MRSITSAVVFTTARLAVKIHLYHLMVHPPRRSNPSQAVPDQEKKVCATRCSTSTNISQVGPTCDFPLGLGVWSSAKTCTILGESKKPNTSGIDATTGAEVSGGRAQKRTTNCCVEEHEALVHGRASVIRMARTLDTMLSALQCRVASYSMF